MTLDEYRAVCTNVIDAMPKSAGSMAHYFQEFALAKLWNVANEAEAQERDACLNYWLLLPMDEELKRDVLRKIAAAGGNK